MIDVNTPEGRKALRELTDKATPGPWDTGVYLGGIWEVFRPRDAGREIRKIADCHAIRASEDAAFIAAAREAVPALIDALDASEREKSVLVDQHDMWKGSWEVYRADNARLQSENASLRARVEALEKVREAAEALFNEIERMADGNDWPWDLGDIGDALDAALAAARGK